MWGDISGYSHDMRNREGRLLMLPSLLFFLYPPPLTCVLLYEGNSGARNGLDSNRILSSHRILLAHNSSGTVLQLFKIIIPILLGWLLQFGWHVGKSVGAYCNSELRIINSWRRDQRHAIEQRQHDWWRHIGYRYNYFCIFDAEDCSFMFISSLLLQCTRWPSMTKW